MKWTLVFAAIVAVASARRLDEFDSLMEAFEDLLEKEKMEKMHKRQFKTETLGDFIVREDTPLYKLSNDLQKRDPKVKDCATTCGPHPTVDESKTCETNWAADYTAKDGCDCLTGFKCCPATCPTPKKTNCFADDNEGLKYGVHIKDCCDCPVVKCQTCPAPDSENNTCVDLEHDKTCYTYKAQGKKADETKCFEATCPFTPIEKTPDETCDKSCMKDSPQKDKCDQSFNVCEGTIAEEDCAHFTKAQSQELLDPKAISCYEENPTRVVDEDAGVFFQDDAGVKTCQKCKKWDYTKKSCAAQNAAADANKCHQHGEDELDKVCWKRTQTEDQCGCNVVSCDRSNYEKDVVKQRFGEKEVCPKGHMKVTGVSICKYVRDVCVTCPPVPKELECKKGEVVDDVDANGCPIKTCVVACIPPEDCTCNKYKLENGSLKCDCKPPRTTPPPEVVPL